MPVSSLTQVEAERRAGLIWVQRYDVAVDLTRLPDGPEVGCVSTVTFGCREPGAETFVDCAGEVLSATLNGAAVDPPECGRIRLAGLAAHNVLRVETVQANTIDGPGVHKAVDPADGEVYVWTSFEPDEARFVWACFDQPDLKAPHAFTVTAPQSWTVTSNSGEPRVEPLGAARRWTFPATPPLSPYNTVVNAGPFHEIRRAAGHDLGLYARRSLAPILDRDADELFSLTEQGLHFFADRFGMPFPQRTYDQVFMPEFGGAMENYGCVTWSDWFLYRSLPTAAERELRAKYLLHEIAHMWFGNIVTMRWWDDLWLNEAFAEFASNWAAVHATPFTDALAGHLARGKLRAYLLDKGPASHPIRQPVPDTSEAASAFDAITYPKGASVLHQLMTYLGEANFASGMTDYFARHAWGTTTLADLIAALGTASGRDLRPWVTGWLETAGTDRLSLEQDVLMAHGPDGGPPRPQVVAIGAYRDNGAALVRTALVSVEVQQARTAVELPPADAYLINDDDLTFATTRSDATTRAVLGSRPLPTTLSRGVALAEIWDRLVTGEASAAEAVRFLTAVLAVETSGSVIEPYLVRAADIAELWSAETDRAELTALVADAARALAELAEHEHVALRTLTRVGGPDDLMGLDGVDLRWRALVRRAELGADVAADVQALLDRDPDPDAWLRALTVQAATPRADAKAAAWQALAIDRTVPVGSVKEVAPAFWRPGQDALLAPYAEQYIELLPSLDRGGMMPAMVLTEWLFPLFGADQRVIDQAVAAADTAAPIVRKTLLERADVVARMLHARATTSS